MQVRPEKLLSVQDSGIDYGGWGDNSGGVQCIFGGSFRRLPREIQVNVSF